MANENDLREVAMEDVDEEVPVEPDQPAQADQEDDHQQAQDAPAPHVELHVFEQAQPNADLEEEVSLIHRKVNRLIGRTDEIPSIKNRINSVSRTTRAPKKFKTDKPASTRPKTSKVFRQDESLLHTVDQRTIGMKNTMDRTFTGLEQLYEQYAELLKEFREQTDRLRELMAPPPPPPRGRSPPPGPSHQPDFYQQLRCAFCDGNHHASDCMRYTTLSERRRVLFDRNRCERCLLRANHMATSCVKAGFCFYCRAIGKGDQPHHSAFCPYKFPI